MEKMSTLRDLLIHEVNDLFSAENQILEALPKMIEAATAPELKAAFTDHLHVTELQVGRLNKVFESLGETPSGESCAAMRGIITEGNKLLSKAALPKIDSAVLDAALIAAAQRVEHYEMAGYGCARTFARRIGEADIARILQDTLDEEGAADHLLTKIAEQGGINQHAKSGAG